MYMINGTVVNSTYADRQIVLQYFIVDKGLQICYHNFLRYNFLTSRKVFGMSIPDVSGSTTQFSIPAMSVSDPNTA